MAYLLEWEGRMRRSRCDLGMLFEIPWKSSWYRVIARERGKMKLLRVQFWGVPLIFISCKCHALHRHARTCEIETAMTAVETIPVSFRGSGHPSEFWGGIRKGTWIVRELTRRDGVSDEETRERKTKYRIYCIDEHRLYVHTPLHRLWLQRI